MGMNNDASTDQEFFARLGIEQAPKAKGIREVMAENAQRAADAQALVARLDATAIKTRAKSL
jgi:hypothetical protein